MIRQRHEERLILRHNPADPGWFDRDRFVLSNGHGSTLLYNLLHLTGYDLGIDDRLGSLEAGKVADIVAAPGNPLDDVHVLERVNFVMKDGVIYKR